MLNYVQAHRRKKQMKDLPYAYFHSMSSGLAFFLSLIFFFFLFKCRNSVWIISDGGRKWRKRKSKRKTITSTFFSMLFILIVTNSCFNRIWEILHLDMWADICLLWYTCLFLGISVIKCKSQVDAFFFCIS